MSATPFPSVSTLTVVVFSAKLAEICTMPNRSISTTAANDTTSAVKSIGNEGKEIDPSKSMKELGANSLDIVEVVSCSMRELKVKVPRAELNKLTNIDELVDLLHRSVQEKAAAAS